jgi:hypothetical protein
LTGQTRDLAEFISRDGRTTVPMRFEPAQSLFVVFRKALAEGKADGLVTQAAAATAGSRNFPATTRLAELAGPWKVSFDPKWGGPESVTFATLEDWSKRKEDGIRFYSGTAIYRKTFEAPSLPGGQRLFLDLGTVKNLARVRLNGQDLGVVWCAPWRVDITGVVKARDNRTG